VHPDDRPCTPILEVCIDSVAGLDAAIDSGAGRVELCSALSVGGLTPSTGLMAAAAAAEIPCFVLIRPRAGDFVYGRRDIDVMLRDIDQARLLGLAGVVFGASNHEHELDEEVLQRLIAHATGLTVVLHRAFDLVSDSGAALESAIQLGFRRVLTSGGARDALAGCDVIRQLVSQAGDRIEVMAGAGVRPDNVVDLVRRSGVTAVHSSCTSIKPDAPGALGAHARALGFYPPSHRVTDPQVIRAMLAAMQAA
jgi:copper homeostasis protein